MESCAEGARWRDLLALTGRGEARLGRIGLDEWLCRSQTWYRGDAELLLELTAEDLISIEPDRPPAQAARRFRVELAFSAH